MSNVTNPSNFDPAQAALTALARAGLRAAEDARRTNTYMVVEENGKVLRESPEECIWGQIPILTLCQCGWHTENPTGTLGAMHTAIAQHRSGISAICQRFGIRRLEVFGSAARADDFDPEHSDADFLVEFAPGVQPGLDFFLVQKRHWKPCSAGAWIWWSRARCATPMYLPASIGTARSSFRVSVRYRFSSCWRNT